ncbi:MAG: YCF48-related protein [Terriglobales bacterium]
MTELPKIVYDRLRAPLPDQKWAHQHLPPSSHPDADLLTGFAEQALSASERAHVLEHLSLCGDCREVVAIALPAVDTAVADTANALAPQAALPRPTPAETKSGWLNLPNFGWPLAWPNLRWAALAAGLALAASLLLMRPGKLNPSLPPSAGSQVATTAPPVSTGQVAASPVPETLAVAKTPAPQSKPAQPFAKKLQDRHVGASHQNAVARRASEAGAVAAAASPAIAAPPDEGSLLARNDAPPIERAKPAPQSFETSGPEEMGSNANGTPSTRTVANFAASSPHSMAATSAVNAEPHAGQSQSNPNSARDNVMASPAPAWQIVAGSLQESLDGGQNWSNALHVSQPLLCFASRGKDVWTGGEAGVLFHSADHGLTWTQVRPSIKAQPVSSDITRIELPLDAEIVVFTSTHEVWSSADGGSTWEKK